MPLLDGKYEIISERALGSEQTLFEATAPDGAAVCIVWYELTPEREARFEHYRRTLRRLKRAELAAVYDVVSRPGAHYVAWVPPREARPAAADRELDETLTEAGFRAEDADIRRDQRRPVIYGLAFDGTDLPTQAGAVSAKPFRRPTVRTVEPPPWLVTLLVTVLLTAASIALLRGGMAARSNDRLVIVPRLSGSEVNDSALRLHELGLIVDAVPLASDRPAGTVLKTDPTAGSQLRPGRAVRLSYALPPGSVTPTEVPRVVARQYPEEAGQSLAAAGLAPGLISRIPAEQAEGLVISQSPLAGARVGEDTTVDLLVSAGPSAQMTFVPDLTGMPIEEARYLARLAGLRPERIIEDAVPAGRATAGLVVAQSLRPNQPVALEDAVLRLIVARAEQVLGAVRSGLPSFVGMTREEAEGIAGVAIEFEEMSDRALPEGVVDQMPSAATAAAERVTLVINVHPVPIPRPAVSANVRTPQARVLQYRWFIEPGIPEQEARVYATTLQGETILLRVAKVSGGEPVSGTWRTRHSGPVRLTLTLNGQPYGGEQLVN